MIVILHTMLRSLVKTGDPLFTFRSAHSRFILSCLLVIGLLFSIASPQAVHAAALTVDTLLDENDGSCSDGDCSLRDAIQVAVAGDTITFIITGTIVLTLGQLNVDKDLIINGPGQDSLTVSGNNTSRVFYIAGIGVTISGLTIAYGYSSEDGGGIYNNGVSTLTNVIFNSNNTSQFGGGLFNNGYASSDLTNVTFSDNSALAGGGMFIDDGTSTITNVTFIGNTADWAGGGLAKWGFAALTNVYFGNNSTQGDGGGMFNWGPTTLTNVTFIGNTAGGGGG